MIFAKVAEVALGLPIQVVSGYKGTAPIRLAFNSDEVGGLSNSWQSFRSTWRKELDNGEVIIVLQLSAKPHPDLPKVPLAMNLAKTDEARKLIQAVAQAHGAAVRPYVLPPGTPKDRVEILRKAFMETVKDPELLNGGGQSQSGNQSGIGRRSRAQRQRASSSRPPSGRAAKRNSQVGKQNGGFNFYF